jgi:cytosine/adenosine deaminase-related metal-dependent hydrolase
VPSPDFTLTARWVFPVCGRPLPGGVVAIAGDRIVAVEPHGAAVPDLDLGDAAVLPGLVNAHTHLDLSGMRGLAPPRLPLTDWLRQVITHRRSRSSEQVRADIHAGLAECIRTGTTLVGDISGDGSSWSILAASPIRDVVFRELLGLTQDRADAAVALAREWLTSHPATPTCRPGLSPHAPYSVCADLFAGAGRLAWEFRCPLATHLAESLDELELLRRHRGPFVDFLRELGVWAPDGLARSPAEVMSLCWGSRRLFIHGNHLAPSARIPRHSTVVCCPRTHAAFGHPPHPFRAFLDRGVRVALGTDSLASNPDLDLLAEARFLHHHHSDLPGEVLLRLATLSGAEALGWDDETGSLEAGKSADLVVVGLPAGDRGDPHDLVLDGQAPPLRVMCRGQWVA